MAGAHQTQSVTSDQEEQIALTIYKHLSVQESAHLCIHASPVQYMEIILGANRAHGVSRQAHAMNWWKQVEFTVAAVPEMTTLMGRKAGGVPKGKSLNLLTNAV